MSSAAGCLRDITATDIMDYMQVDHPHNLKEMWKMKHATPARIGIGHCGPRYTTEAQLRFLASHAAANDAVFNEVPEEVVKEQGVFEVRTKCSDKHEMLLRPDWGRIFLPDAGKRSPKTVYIIQKSRFILVTDSVHHLSQPISRIFFLP